MKDAFKLKENVKYIHKNSRKKRKLITIITIFHFIYLEINIQIFKNRKYKLSMSVKSSNGYPRVKI